MYRYSNYIARHLIHSTLLITFSLTSIIWLTQALRFIDFIVNQGVSIDAFVKLTALLLPSLILMILPPALFCSMLFVYNKLKTDSELVVMQAVGLSKWRLAIPAMQVAAGVTILGYIIALYVLPLTYREFRDMQSFLRNNYVSILLQEGVFSNPVEGLTVYTRERDKDGTMRGILVQDNRQHENPVTMMAEEGRMVETPQGPRFLLTNGNRQEMRKGTLSFLDFKSYTLDISLYTQAARNRLVDPQELFVNQLFTHDPNVSRIDNMKRYAEGHQRLIWPFYSLTLTLIALAVILSGEFNRRGSWHRIAMAITFGIATIVCAVGLRGAMAQQHFMIAFAYANAILPAAIAVGVLVDRISMPKFLQMRQA